MDLDMKREGWKIFLVGVISAVLVFTLAFWLMGCAVPVEAPRSPEVSSEPLENPYRVSQVREAPKPKETAPVNCEPIQAPERVIMGGETVAQLGPWATGTFDGQDFAPSLYWNTKEEAETCDKPNTVAFWDEKISHWTKK